MHEDATACAGKNALSISMMPEGVARRFVPYEPTPKMIIMIMLDGFRPDYLSMYSPPHLLRLVANGAWIAEAEAVFPAITTPNQTSFVTGALPRRHGIPNVARYDRQLDRIIRPLRDNSVPTIAEIMAKAGWQTTAVNHFMLENRGAQEYLRGDMDTLIRCIQGGRTGLLVYYDASIDSAGHKYGAYSNSVGISGSHMRDAVLNVDAAIGRLLNALDQQGITQQTTIVIASDHGMSPKDGLVIDPTLEQIAADNHLRIAFANEAINPDTELVAIIEGAIYLYWRQGMNTPEREMEVLNLLRTIDGIDIYTASEMEELGADSERLGDIALIPKPGRHMIPGSRRGGLHGTPQEAKIMMLFWGMGIQPAVVLHHASIVDIVPTLLTLAKVEKRDSIDGKPLYGLLTRSSMKGRILQSSGHLVFYDVNLEEPGSIGSITLDGQITREIAAIAFDFPATTGHASELGFALQSSTDAKHFETVYACRLRPDSSLKDSVRYLYRPIKARYIRMIFENVGQGELVNVAEICVR